MEAQKKFKLKRQYKTLTWIGYLSILIWILFITVTLIVRKHSDADWQKLGIIIPIMIGLMLPIFTGIACTTYAQFSRQQLLNYKKAIYTYRARKFLLKAIAYIQLGEIQQAIDAYNNTIIRPESSLVDFVYGMIISACYQSTDEKHHNIGIQRMVKVLNYYDPEKVDLN